jgi:hypothetical protein
MMHRLLAVAEFGLDAIKGKHVHHVNGLRWDNRLDNLEVLTPQEHIRGHHQQVSDKEFLRAVEVNEPATISETIKEIDDPRDRSSILYHARRLVRDGELICDSTNNCNLYSLKETQND